jgi:eukaryotic-like serine/threonine-protein kinase
MTTHPQATQLPIDALLLRWEDLRDQGRTVPAEELAADTPDLIAELAHRIAALRSVDAMLAPESVASDATRCGANWGEVVPAFDPDKAFSAVARMVEPRFHARGGLGQVLVVRQEELDRQVALKRIRPDKLLPAARRRFIREAAITARLQHPGIVPIYGLGQDDDGPFYTMPFIEGRTLDEAIQQFHRDDAYRHDPGRRSVEFRRLLQRFVTVCETIAYAHDQGIVHRDLKPSNIMLGPYGETLVMDWGLARRYAGDHSDSETEGDSRSPSPSSDDVTATGAVLGTPQYMSPEQAAGLPAGPASDIFSLGAILYAILTGKPPYEAKDRAGPNALGPVPELSSVAPRARDANLPRALEAVCLKAMAVDPHDRYMSAGALAEDLTKWLADEPVPAYDEPLVARARRWVRHHQRLVAGAAAAVLMAALGLAVLTAEVSVSNRRLVTARAAAEKLTAEVSASNRRLTAARAEAEKERDQAKEITAFLVSSFRMPNPEQEGSKVTVAEVLGSAIKDLEGRPSMTPTTRASILDAVGLTYRGLGLVPGAIGLAEQAVSIRRRELGADDHQTLIAMGNLALAYQDAGRVADAIALNEQVLASLMIKLGENHPDTLNAMNNLTLAYAEGGRLDRAIPLGERTLEARRARLGEDHTDTLTTMNNLALAYKTAGQLDRAIPLYEQVLKAVVTARGEDHFYALGVMNNLAAAYLAEGQLDHAIPLFERLLERVRAAMGESHPKTLTTLNNLAAAYRHAGHPERAIPLHERALEGVAATLGADHPYALKTMGNLAQDYEDAGQRDRAIPLLEQVLKAGRIKQGTDHPDTLRSMNNLASAYKAADQLDRAIPLLEQALEAGRIKQGESHQDTLGTQRNLAHAYLRAGRFRDAEPLYRKVVETAGRNRPRIERFYSDSLTQLGRCLIRQQKYAEALPFLRECVEIKEKTQPDDWTTAEARGLLGEGLAGLGKYPEAEPLLLAAQVGLVGRREKIRPLDRDAILRDAGARLVRLYQAWGKPAEVEKWKKELPTVKPSSSRSPR